MRRLVPYVAGQIAADLDSFGDAYLPSHSKLAERYGASRPVIAAALGELAAKGLIELPPHARARLRKARPPLPSPSVPGALTGFVRQSLTTGRYKTGEPLPKLAWFYTEFRGSYHSVHRALEALVQEGLLHREKRRYVAGPAPQRPAPRHVRKPIVVIVAPDHRSWDFLSRSARTRDFGSAFTLEVNRSGFISEYAVDRPTSKGAFKLNLQIEEIVGARQRWGDAYRGALIVGSPGKYTDYSHTVQTLLSLNEPVVWFDSGEWQPSTTVSSPRFYHMHHSELNIARCAIEALRDSGHRKALYVATEGEGWQGRRRKLLCEEAAGRGDFELVPWRIRPVSDGLPDDGPEALPNRLRRCLQVDNSRLRRAIQELSGSSNPPLANLTALVRQRDAANIRPLDTGYQALYTIYAALNLLPLLEDRTITAVLAANDQIALNHLLNTYPYLGIRCPEDFSLLSFDNEFRDRFINLSSIDYGFGDFGYRAFHLLAQDLPDLLHRKKHAHARPFVVDRGTIGKID